MGLPFSSFSSSGLKESHFDRALGAADLEEAEAEAPGVMMAAGVDAASPERTGGGIKRGWLLSRHYCELCLSPLLTLYPFELSPLQTYNRLL